MQTLAQILKVDLTGQVETITVSELRGNPGEVFQQVALGKKFLVRRNGKLICKVAPVEPADVQPVIEVRRRKTA